MFINEESPHLSFRQALPFALVAVLWFGLGLLLIQNSALSIALQGSARKGLFIFWGICVADLLAMAKLYGILAQMISGPEEKQTGLIFPASYWGAIKLASTGLFITVLIYNRGIPHLGILAGLGTLVVVPMAGGLFDHWLRHNTRQKFSQGIYLHA